MIVVKKRNGETVKEHSMFFKTNKGRGDKNIKMKKI